MRASLANHLSEREVGGEVKITQSNVSAPTKIKAHSKQGEAVKEGALQGNPSKHLPKQSERGVAPEEWEEVLVDVEGIITLYNKQWNNFCGG